MQRKLLEIFHDVYSFPLRFVAQNKKKIFFLNLEALIWNYFLILIL